MTAPKTLHCWEDGPETDDGCGTTCLLKDGHDGPHVWSRDDLVMVSFPKLPPAKGEGE